MADAVGAFNDMAEAINDAGFGYMTLVRTPFETVHATYVDEAGDGYDLVITPKEALR